MVEALWRSYKSYSGVLVKGVNPVGLPSNIYNHMQRSFYLTAQIESPKWGTVQSYDGAGISGGPLHNTAFQPSSGEQGSLFSLLSTIISDLSGKNNANLVAFQKLVKASGWEIGIDGKVRYISTKKLVTGSEIRNKVAPINGVVPKSGLNWTYASTLALILHNLLNDPATYAAQTKYSIDYLIRGQKALELAAYTYILGVDRIDLPNVTINVTLDKYFLTKEQDLAFCVYHSHSVNAPGPAKTCIDSAMKFKKEDFPRKLLYLLGTSSYGNWRDDSIGNNRYDRTRLAAKESGLWEPSFFEKDGIMPENF